MRLYACTEAAAGAGQEREALALIRDDAAKEQLIRGVTDSFIRWELWCMDKGGEDRPFSE